jgi:hypothetical protein
MSQTNSNWSPTSMRHLPISPAGSSRTLCTFMLILVTLNGGKSCHSFTTRNVLVRAITSIAKSIPTVWMPEEGVIRSPHPASSRRRPARPTRRVRQVSAIVIPEPIVVAFVLFFRIIFLAFIAKACHELGNFLSTVKYEANDNQS